MDLQLIVCFWKYIAYFLAVFISILNLSSSVDLSNEPIFVLVSSAHIFRDVLIIAINL